MKIPLCFREEWKGTLVKCLAIQLCKEDHPRTIKEFSNPYLSGFKNFFHNLKAYFFDKMYIVHCVLLGHYNGLPWWFDRTKLKRFCKNSFCQIIKVTFFALWFHKNFELLLKVGKHRNYLRIFFFEFIMGSLLILNSKIPEGRSVKCTANVLYVVFTVICLPTKSTNNIK